MIQRLFWSLHRRHGKYVGELEGLPARPQSTGSSHPTTTEDPSEPTHEGETQRIRESEETGSESPSGPEPDSSRPRFLKLDPRDTEEQPTIVPHLELELYEESHRARSMFTWAEADLSNNFLLWVLLKTLASKPRGGFLESELSDAVWLNAGRTERPTKQTVRATISDLREHLVSLNLEIKYLRRMGYRLQKIQKKKIQKKKIQKKKKEIT
jgi:hypothetical protein